MSTKDWIEKDFYKVLGVSKTANAAEIKKAYRALARTHHPDANANDAKSEAKFKDVSEAYDVLSDPAKRKEYDEARSLFGGGGFRGAGGQPGNFNFDLGDVFGRGGGTGGGLGDVLGGLFNRGGGTTRAPRRGADVETTVTLAFTEALHGVTLPLRLTGEAPCAACAGTGAKAGTTPRVCATCGGSGSNNRNVGNFAFAEPCRDCRGRGLVVDDPCPTCNGSGRGHSSRTVQARIPAGVKDGTRIRLKGKGAPGERGGPAGDLFVMVTVAAHPVFGRVGDNLTVVVPVTFVEAALGAEVEVPTIASHPVRLKLPAGTASGRTFRVRGRGAPRRDGTHGDLLVSIEVAVPAKLSTAAKEALAAFGEATSDHDPRADLRTRAAAASDAATS
jgi:molecular chaperone DnaJ